MIYKIIFVIFSIICGLSAFIPYLFDTFKLKTKPHIYTWIIWAMTQGTATFAIFYGGGKLGGVELAIGVILQIVVIIFSLKYGTKDITKSDKIILLIAFLAIIVWWQLKQPILSVILVSAIDVFGYIPTFRKSYKDPWSETLATWVLFAMSDIFAILALSKYNFLTVTYLATITVVNISFFIFCALRRSFSKKLNKNQATKIAKEFLEINLEKEGWFVKIKPFIKAFILYGSVAKGTNKSDSDIDVMIILPLEQEKKYTKGEYFYDYKNQKINIVLRSIEKLRKIADEKKDLFQREIFREAEVIKDSDGEVLSLLDEIKNIENYASIFLGKCVKIKIDRPINSKHPKHGFVYEVNYGFVPNTKAPDGEEIDVYLLGVNESVDEFTGKCIAVIHRKDDNDDKLVVVPEDIKSMKDKEILKAVNFQEKWFDSIVIR